ncbi:MAG: HD domain-containing protein [Anaerolineae bacterium]|nr:HD domain-containing protein [Anaerolineae bacterium]
MSYYIEYDRLIALISAAEDAPLFSPEAWRAYLGAETETVRTFSAQLAREWQPLHVPSALCQTVMAQAQAHLIASGLRWRNLWAHVLRVTGNALMLARAAEISTEQAFLLGILHDVGKLDEIQHGVPHESVSALMAQQWLQQHDTQLSVQVIERLVAAIAKRGAPSDPLVKVLHDADKLDKIGATGILRRLSSYLGRQNPMAALHVVLDELARFPQMHYLDAARLAESKRNFTAVFLTRALALAR